MAKKKTTTKARKKPVRKAPKKAVKRAQAPRRKPASGGFVVTAAPELETRLKALAVGMGKTIDQLLRQALAEFVDTWEDHQRTVAALREEDDRVQLVVPKD